MIHLYAEHLLHIRTLSIQAALSTVSNEQTKANLFADGTLLTLTHENESASIKLPVNIPPNQQSKINLAIPAVPSKDLSFRIQLEEKDGVANSLLGNGQVAENGNVSPWTATSLTKQTEICCSSCGSVLVERGKVKIWKDLPSEGWAEMMDFWHCHKPDESRDPNMKKAYDASSRLALEPGVGLMDVMDILLMPEDCNDAMITSSLDSTPTGVDSSLVCSNCKFDIGHIDSSTQGYKLRKLRLSLSRTSERPASGYQAEKWLASLLLFAMDNQGVRKFVVHDGKDPSKPALKLWIFTPDLYISSSVTLSKEPIRVAKTLWQDAEAPADIVDKMNGSGYSEGELQLRYGEMAMLRDCLARGGKLLPESARRFQGWSVGLLERFTEDDM